MMDDEKVNEIIKIYKIAFSKALKQKIKEIQEAGNEITEKKLHRGVRDILFVMNQRIPR